MFEDLFAEQPFRQALGTGGGDVVHAGLFQHGGACSLTQNDLATIQSFLIHNGADQCGFTHTVFSDQTDTFFRPNVKTDVIEQNFGAELFFEIL